MVMRRGAMGIAGGVGDIPGVQRAASGLDSAPRVHDPFSVSLKFAGKESGSADGRMRETVLC